MLVAKQNLKYFVQTAFEVQGMNSKARANVCRECLTIQGRAVHRAQRGTCPQVLDVGRGHWVGTDIEEPANAFSLYIYFINKNRSVKSDFC